MRRLTWILAVAIAPACVVREYREPPPVVYAPPPPPPPPPPQPPPPAAEVEVSGYIEPPLEQPAAVAIPYAPPPMRWDPPPPPPYEDAVWVGGHWTWWNGEWVWARGHWARPPSPAYVWCEPYYEYRGDNIIFVAGFWRPVVRVFVPPPPTVYVPVVVVRPTVVYAYARPVGPHGVFVPAPPGSAPGVIVPAPVGTSPSVVVSAPPVARPGMVIRPVGSRGGPTTVEVVAPAGVTRSGQPVNASIPANPHQAAALHPVVAAPPPPMRTIGGPAPSGPPAQAQPMGRPFQGDVQERGATGRPFHDVQERGGPVERQIRAPQEDERPAHPPATAQQTSQVPPKLDDQRHGPAPKLEHDVNKRPTPKSVPPKGPTYEKPNKGHERDDR
jgi:hypothetical protein